MTELTTSRLRLRSWRESDLPAFAAMSADPVVMEHYAAPQTLAEAAAFVSRSQAGLEANGFGRWAVEIPGVAPFIGYVGLSVPPWQAHFTPCVEVGWRFAAAWWGQGIATEAARAALRYGFEVAGLPEIVSFTVAANRRSWRVMERLGMGRDPRDDFDHPALPAGHRLRGHILYRLRQQDWAAMTFHNSHYRVLGAAQ